MTTPLPWIPAPNPGGNYRTLVRRALQQQIEANSIPGLDAVRASDPGPERVAGSARGGNSQFAATLCLRIADDSETRTATTGPIDRGGKMAHYEVEMTLYHFTFDEGDWDAGQDDYERIIGLALDCLRGPGRDLGRPDVIVQVGEWPREQSFHTHHEAPMDYGGTIMRMGTTGFTVTQYMQQQPAGV